MSKNGTYLCSAPNNGIGRTFISLLKRYLNTSKWHLRVRGRHPKRSQLALKLGLHKHAFDRDMPLEHAKTLVVYITKGKRKRYNNNYWEDMGN